MIRDLIQNIGWRSALDIALVAVLFYQIIAMLKGTRAAQVLIGMLVIFLAYVISSLLELETLNWIISKFYSSFIFVVIVLFQDDIRRLLTRFGRGPFVSGLDENSGLRVIDEVVNAAVYLSHDRIGALLVFERGIGLDRLYDHAVRLESLVSEQVLVCIFQSFSPLHDGAVIIQKNRLTCASAQLPLSKNPSFSKKLGTRHSAAVGISEETDAVVLVISEETGNVSIAWDGQMQKQANSEAIRRTLIGLLMPQTEKKSIRLLRNSLRQGEGIRAAVFRNVQYMFGRSKNTFWSKKNNQVNSAHSSTKNNKNAPGSHKVPNEFSSTEMENKLASVGTKTAGMNLRFPKYAKLRTAKADGTQLVMSSAPFPSPSQEPEHKGKQSNEWKEDVESDKKRDSHHILNKPPKTNAFEAETSLSGKDFSQVPVNRKGNTPERPTLKPMETWGNEPEAHSNAVAKEGSSLQSLWPPKDKRDQGNDEGSPHEEHISAHHKEPLEEETFGQREPNALAQNKAAHALSKITQEERFVPPNPPPPPPRDVKIGGISLNPPLSEVERPTSQDDKKKGE